jgi:hypothetical protein
VKKVLPMHYTKEYLNLLAAINPEYTSDSLIDFHELDNNTPTKIFTSFVYETVKNPQSLMKIEPFELFLIKNAEINAFACRHNSLSLIIFHHSLYKAFENRIRQTLPSASEYTSGIFDSISGYIDVKMDFFLFQMMLLFIFYHELAHLYQYKRKEGNQHLAFEKYNLTIGNKFDQEKHAMEIDADIFAANNVAFHIQQYWNNFPEEVRNVTTLSTLIIITMVAILLLFYELSQELWHQIYFKEFNHPHELVRTAYIIEAIIATISKNLKVDEVIPDYKYCIQNSLTIAEDLTNKTMINKHGFAQVFFHYKEDINHYLKNEMEPFMQKTAYLVMHQYNKI